MAKRQLKQLTFHSFSESLTKKKRDSVEDKEASGQMDSSGECSLYRQVGHDGCDYDSEESDSESEMTLTVTMLVLMKILIALLTTATTLTQDVFGIIQLILTSIILIHRSQLLISSHQC